MASTGANRTEGQVDAKGGVKFELVGIPEVMLEESNLKQKRKTVEHDDRLLVFDMGGGSEAKKPALGSKKPFLSSQNKKGQGKQK